MAENEELNPFSIEDNSSTLHKNNILLEDIILCRIVRLHQAVSCVKRFYHDDTRKPRSTMHPRRGVPLSEKNYQIVMAVIQSHATTCRRETNRLQELIWKQRRFFRKDLPDNSLVRHRYNWMQAFLVQVIQMDKATSEVWKAITALFLLKPSQWVIQFTVGKVRYWWLNQFKNILNCHNNAYKASATIKYILGEGVFGFDYETANIKSKLVLCAAFSAASESLPKPTTDQTSEQVIKRPRVSSESDEDMNTAILVRMRDVKHMSDISICIRELADEIEDLRRDDFLGMNL
jgi:hypothetical protein